MYFSFGVCFAFAVLSAVRLLFSPHISVLDWPTTVWLSGFARIQCCLRTLLVESGHWSFFFYTITLGVCSLSLGFLFSGCFFVWDLISFLFLCLGPVFLSDFRCLRWKLCGRCLPHLLLTLVFRAPSPSLTPFVTISLAYLLKLD